MVVKDKANSISSRNAHIKELKTDILNKDMEIDALKTKMSKQDEVVRSLKAQLEAAQKTIQEERKRFNNVRDDRDCEKQISIAMTRENKQLRAENDRLKTEAIISVARARAFLEVITTIHERMAL